MSKLTKISLDDLYARKITSSVEAAILEKEDFSKINNRWCEKVCRLKCKNPLNNHLKLDPVDVLIIQDFRAFDDPKFNKSGASIETKHLSLLKEVASQYLKNCKYSVTSLLKCSLQPDDIKKGKAPTELTLLKCKPYLHAEIEKANPKVILTLCTSATKALGLKKSNATNQGEIHSYNGIPVVLGIHPRITMMLRQNSSGAFWGPDFYSVMCRDFEKVQAILDGKLRVPNLMEALEKYKKNIHIARSARDVRVFVGILEEALMSGCVASFDTETTGLDPWSPKAKLITIQFGIRNSTTGDIEAYVFPLWHRQNTWYDPEVAWKLLAPLLTNPDYLKIGHNIKFDILYVAATTGVRVKGILYDTMLLLHALNSGLQGMYGLKKAVWDWLPETELGGYEDLLPKLTKAKQEAVEEDEEVEVENVS